MQFINIKDYKTGRVIKALNFGGPKCYKLAGRYVWGPEGGESLVIDQSKITLNPFKITLDNSNIWTVVSHQNPGTTNWRTVVKNSITQEEKIVFPFSRSGEVYELKCMPGTWVMASCGGYKIESTWEGKRSYELFRLKGTGEVMYKLGALSEIYPRSIGQLWIVDQINCYNARWTYTGGETKVMREGQGYNWCCAWPNPSPWTGTIVNFYSPTIRWASPIYPQQFVLDTGTSTEVLLESERSVVYDYYGWRTTTATLSRVLDLRLQLFSSFYSKTANGFFDIANNWLRITSDVTYTNDRYFPTFNYKIYQIRLSSDIDYTTLLDILNPCSAEELRFMFGV